MAQPGAEWPATLDVDELRRSGRQPTPFQVFVLKVHSRCDLACRYCYMFEHADQSWKTRPQHMSSETVASVAHRIAEHATVYALPSVTVVLHGGEPLLAGPDRLAFLVRTLREVVPAPIHVSIQTNGVRLDGDFLALLDSLDVHISVSLDGDPAATDRHRMFRDGRSSHALVAQSLSRLVSGYRHRFSGLLCTIDLRNDPVGTYESLLVYAPPTVDFLLPHGTWTDPPPARPGDTTTPYADWLIEIFNHWYPAPRTSVRLFDEIMHLLLGGASAVEAVGLSPSGVLVIETDGSIEQSDYLKTAYEGAPATGLHVRDDPFDRALDLPGIVARQIGADALSATCTSCELARICGGGLYAHRYKKGNGFLNPSVYCSDLFKLITHIQRTMVHDLERLR